MAWETVAEGANFNTLKQIVADKDVPPGTIIMCEFDTKFPSYFDLPGNEWIFQQKAPPGCKVIDVWGEGPIWPWATGKGYVKMEVQSVSGGISGIGIGPLAAIIGWISAHWVAIIIATVVITLLVMFIRITMKVTKTVEQASPYLIWALIITGVCVAGYFGYKYVTREEKVKAT